MMWLVWLCRWAKIVQYCCMPCRLATHMVALNDCICGKGKTRVGLEAGPRLYDNKSEVRFRLPAHQISQHPDEVFLTFECGRLSMGPSGGCPADSGRCFWENIRGLVDHTVTISRARVAMCGIMRVRIRCGRCASLSRLWGSICHRNRSREHLYYGWRC